MHMHKIKELLDKTETILGPIKDSPCLVWIGTSINGGYGAASFDSKTWPAHRLMWTLIKGPIPKGLCVCHSCDNPACINTDHLWLGTNNDNTQDKMTKGRHKGNTILTKTEVGEIKFYLHNSKYTVQEIADMYRVCYFVIHKIKSGRSWIKVPIVNPKGPPINNRFKIASW